MCLTVLVFSKKLLVPPRQSQNVANSCWGLSLLGFNDALLHAAVGWFVERRILHELEKPAWPQSIAFQAISVRSRCTRSFAHFRQSPGSIHANKESQDDDLFNAAEKQVSLRSVEWLPKSAELSLPSVVLSFALLERRGSRALPLLVEMLFSSGGSVF